MRKLALFAVSFAVSIFLAYYVLPDTLKIVLAALLLLSGLVALFFNGNTKKRIMLISFGAFAGIMWYMCYYAIFYLPAENMCGQNVEIVAKVNDFPKETEYGKSVELIVKNENGVSIRATAYAYNDVLTELVPGDEIKVKADISSVENTEGTRTWTSASKGNFLFVKNIKELNVITKGGCSPRYIHRYAAKAVKSKIAEIFPESTKGLMQAILTGARAEINKNVDLTAAMSRTGVYHIIAVSGMHVAFLVSLISFVFGRKRKVAVITSAALVLFAGISGFTPSVVRAVIMQLFIMSAPIFDREGDSITSLSAALLLLLIVNPFSIANVGLQLSFAAVAGIILISEKVHKYIYLHLKALAPKSKRMKGVFNFIAGGIASTLGAELFTLPLCAIYFGNVSLAAPIVNLLILWAVSPAFCIGAGAVAVGYIFVPAGKAVAWVASMFLRYICTMVELFAKTYLSSVYLDNIFLICWFVYIYAVIVLFLLIKPSLREGILPACFGALSLCAILFITAVRTDMSGIEISVLDVGQGQSIVITSGEYTAVVDCGSISGESSGRITAEYLYSIGRQNVDILVLTHYHADHVNGIEELMAYVDIDMIAASTDDKSENSLHDEVVELANKHDSDIIYVEEDMKVLLGDTTLRLYEPLGVGYENECGICILVEEDGFETLITGDISSYLERELIRKYDLPDIECLVVGHHGSKYSTCDELLESTTPETAVISVGSNTYGHPTEEVIDRLNKRNIDVYRTDQCGTITISPKEME